MRAMLVAVLSLGAQSVADALPAPLSIDEMRSRSFSASLEFERELDGGAGFSAYLVSYRSAGLKVFAMVAVPHDQPPAAGFPVIVANHGFHPDPPQYGITAEGVDSRPGDYYRSIPELYAGHGFLVVIPDYRGHNVSEGLEFTEGFLASGYFTEDVVTLLSALDGIDEADIGNVFMWGHSLGAEVSLRALLVTDVIRGAALWSAVGGEIWDQAYYYERYQNRLAEDGSDVGKERIEALRLDIAELDGPFEWTAIEPLRYLQYLSAPIVLQHAAGDSGAPYRWSERLAKELYLLDHPYRFYSYAGTDHFFQGEMRRQAVERDVQYFRSLIQPTDADARGESGLTSQSIP